MKTFKATSTKQDLGTCSFKNFRRAPPSSLCRSPPPPGTAQQNIHQQTIIQDNLKTKAFFYQPSGEKGKWSDFFMLFIHLFIYLFIWSAQQLLSCYITWFQYEPQMTRNKSTFWREILLHAADVQFRRKPRVCWAWLAIHEWRERTRNISASSCSPQIHKHLLP